MTKIKLLLIAFILLSFYNGNSQNITIDTLLWENGNYSIVSELDKVWITQKKGPTLKNVKIHTIDTTGGKIEYYSDGTYHDVLISNIEMITPGKLYNHALFFRNSNTPVIVRVPSENLYAAKSSFIFHTYERTEPAVVETAAKPASNDYSEANSAIIFSNGNKIHIKLISINSQTVSYKRLDLLNGPTYIMNLSIPGSMKQARVNTVNGYTIIDYRL